MKMYHRYHCYKTGGTLALLIASGTAKQTDSELQVLNGKPMSVQAEEGEKVL